MCPRCKSWDTKFCYNNNKKITQPRYKCNECKRKFTKGGKIRDIPPRHGGSRNRPGSTRREGFPKPRHGRMRRKQSRSYREEPALSVSDESDEEAYYDDDESEEEHPRKKLKRKDWEEYSSSGEEDHPHKPRVTEGTTTEPKHDKAGCSSMTWFKPVIDLISKAIKDGCAGIAYDKQDEKVSNKRRQQQVVAPAI